MNNNLHSPQQWYRYTTPPGLVVWVGYFFSTIFNPAGVGGLGVLFLLQYLTPSLVGGLKQSNNGIQYATPSGVVRLSHRIAYCNQSIFHLPHTGGALRILCNIINTNPLYPGGVTHCSQPYKPCIPLPRRGNISS